MHTTWGKKQWIRDKKEKRQHLVIHNSLTLNLNEFCLFINDGTLVFFVILVLLFTSYMYIYFTLISLGTSDCSRCSNPQSFSVRPQVMDKGSPLDVGCRIIIQCDYSFSKLQIGSLTWRELCTLQTRYLTLVHGQAFRINTWQLPIATWWCPWQYCWSSIGNPQFV
jgi:hypothetical protein